MRYLALSFALLLLSCNRDPLGADQLRLPLVNSIELAPESLVSYSRHVPLGQADPMLLGRDAEYQSRILLKFGLSDSSLDSVAALKLILHPGSGTLMPFVCRPCSTPWTSEAATWRMADEENPWAIPGGDYWEIDLCRDTLGSESLVAELDIRHLDTLVRKSYGLILLPLDTGFCSIKSTGAISTAPRLRLTFLDSTSRNYTVIDDCHIMDTISVRAHPYELYVGSGVAFRTWLYFNLESIPAAATIARADLCFLPQVMYRRRETLGFGCHRLTEPYRPREKNAGFRQAADARTIFVPADTTDTIVRLDLRGLLQHWTAHPDSNFGLLITAEPEYAAPWRVRLPRIGPAGLRLRIEYVLPPEDRFHR
jgi:hypothetical protein